MTLFLDACRSAIGHPYVVTDPKDMAPSLTDWRQRFTGKARALLKPANTEEVAALVRLCNQHKIPIVPQGGNTGLVLGSVPDQSGDAVVLSLLRMNTIRSFDVLNNSMTVEAGCLLQHIQDAAEQIDRLFPLSLAAEGSCTIGGNLATNAGGTAVLRYGSARELCLGLEVVTAQGEIWQGLRGLRKDNTGFDLRDIFIGAEGTLGIITAAVLKLFPRPKIRLTAFAALTSAKDALAFLSLAQDHCGAALTGFELMSHLCMQLVEKHFPQLVQPFSQPSPHYILLELSDNESPQHAESMLEGLMAEALEKHLIKDAVVATSVAQSIALWRLREHIPLAQAAEGKNIKHDISLPISRIDQFIGQTDAMLQELVPDCRMVTFGHLGDGNLHYNVSPPEGEDGDALLARQAEIHRLVHDSVQQFGGSISAEHGLGALKREEIRRYKSDIEMQLMERIKRALDPENIMNPGKVI